MRDERGATLMEMLVAMSIVGVISSAIIASIVVGLRTTDDTRARIAEARDVQLTATYFIPDVQSATDVSTADTTCAGATPLVRLRWTDEGVQHDVAYLARTVGTERRLTRRTCLDGGTASDIDVAHHLSTTAAPVVSCDPACGSADTVTMDVTLSDGATFSLTGSRRAA